MLRYSDHSGYFTMVVSVVIQLLVHFWIRLFSSSPIRGDRDPRQHKHIHTVAHKIIWLAIQGIRATKLAVGRTAQCRCDMTPWRSGCLEQESVRPWRRDCLEQVSFGRRVLTALSGRVLAVKGSLPWAGEVDDLTQAMDCDLPCSQWNWILWLFQFEIDRIYYERIDMGREQNLKVLICPIGQSICKWGHQSALFLGTLFSIFSSHTFLSHTLLLFKSMVPTEVSNEEVKCKTRYIHFSNFRVRAETVPGIMLWNESHVAFSAFCKKAAISNAVFSGRERVLTEKIGSIEFGWHRAFWWY